MKKLLGLLCVAAATTSAPITAAGTGPRVNAPYFPATVPYAETGVSWFGQVDPLKNYTDIRVAYTDTEVWVTLSVVDQWLFEDDAATRTPASLEQWDAATLLIDTSGSATSTSATCFRFVGELNWWRPRTDYQAMYAGNGSGWTLGTSSAFTTEAGWRGDAPNNTGADKGWTITFHIPYAAVGKSGAPSAGTTWRMGVIVHDKDSAAGAATTTSWPDTLVRDQPTTWGQFGFGLRTFNSNSQASGQQTYTIRHNLAGAVVSDAMVGGGSTCGTSDYFNVWGSLNYAASTTLVAQNESDISDFPCFSKIYIDFPLTSLPPGKAVVSATLTVYQFGGSDPTQAQRSLIQVMTVGSPWSESTITWNNAPAPVENVSQSWADVIPSALPWPGAARNWDVSWALAGAYTTSSPSLRLALYEADSAYHSGKYFTSSDTGEWNAVGRPTLQVVLGSPSVPPTAPTNVRIVP
ncbi:MAG TPA: DNRLRE domain-containing protein [Vicinamibacterales bacterium]